MEKKKKMKHFYDYSLLFSVLFLTGFGLVMMYSASGYAAQSKWSDAMYFFKRQAVFAGAGIVGMLFFSRFIDYHLLTVVNLPFYLVSLLLLFLTFLIGVASHGSARWLNIGGIGFQPSELMKIAVIIMIAVQITHFGYRINETQYAAQVLLLGLLPMVLVAKTNLSTGIIIGGITVIMLFIAVKNYLHFLLLGGAAGAIYVFAYPLARFLEKIHVLQGYQIRRILAWKDPGSYADETFQTLQGLYAIGSGGIFGKGLGESIQKFLMPEAQNDMIFTIICEELGLFGAVSLMLIYAFIIYRMFDIARNARDLFGSMLVIGVMCHVSLQAILNIAVATNAIPNTGITLPFISYGGTSLLLLMGEIGIVLSVSRQIELEPESVKGAEREAGSAKR
ncbi:MAG: FtsW/RodA/SpoVE family cell cycle protein [Oribacterium sp.]